jgi:hypothetical protein
MSVHFESLRRPVGGQSITCQFLIDRPLSQIAYKHIIRTDRWRLAITSFSLVQQFLFLSRGSPICSALFLKLTLKNDTFIYLYYSKHFGNASYFKFPYGYYSYTRESPTVPPNDVAASTYGRRGGTLLVLYDHHIFDLTTITYSNSWPSLILSSQPIKDSNKGVSNNDVTAITGPYIRTMAIWRNDQVVLSSLTKGIVRRRHWKLFFTKHRLTILFIEIASFLSSLSKVLLIDCFTNRLTFFVISR